MPSGRVTEAGKIFLGGNYYPITGQVRRVLASQFPQKVVFGDYTAESNPRVSTLTWRSFPGGIGKNIGRYPDDLGRAWFGKADLSVTDHCLLAPLKSTTASVTGTPAALVQHLGTLGNNLYAACRTNGATGPRVDQYTVGSDSWTNRRTLLADPSAMVVGNLAGTTTMAVATSTEVDYTTDGTTWARNTTDMSLLAYWRDLLFGVASTTLYFTNDLSAAWTSLTSFTGAAQFMFTGPTAEDPTSDAGLYIATTQGLLVYDPEDERLLRTPLEYPANQYGGIACAVWRGAIYVASGLTVYEYRPGVSVRNIGLDLDDGVPSTYGSAIQCLVPTIQHLYAVADDNIDGNSLGGTTSLLARYDGKGWDVIDTPASFVTTHRITAVANDAAGLATTHRLWVPSGTAVAHWQLPLSVANPLQNSTWTYSAGPDTIETPWVKPEADQLWTAVELAATTTHPTTSETIILEYALNLVETYYYITTLSRTGEYRIKLPPKVDPTGIPFFAIKFRATLARGSTTTNTPDLQKLALVYSKNTDTLWGFEVVIPLQDNTLTARQVRRTLETAVATQTLLEFTFKDEENDTETHFVRVFTYETNEVTGPSEGGEAKLFLVEMRGSGPAKFVQALGDVFVGQLPPKGTVSGGISLGDPIFRPLN